MESTSLAALLSSNPGPSTSTTKPPPSPSYMTYPPLLNLPLELHHIISSYLSPSSYLSFRLTHPHTYHSLPPPKQPSIRNLDACGRIAIRTYLAPYLASPVINNTTTAPSPSPSQTSSPEKEIRCALCKAVYPAHLFRSAASSACAKADLGSESVGGMGCHAPSTPAASSSTSTTPTHPTTQSAATAREATDVDIVELPDRVCAWHVGRLIRVVYVDSPAPSSSNTDTDADGEPTSAQQQSHTDTRTHAHHHHHHPPCPPASAPAPGTWTSTTSPLCMHCGAVRAWRRCGCACDSCGEREARIYTRIAERGWRMKRAVFWRDGEAGLWVREVGVGVGAVDRRVVFV